MMTNSHVTTTCFEQDLVTLLRTGYMNEKKKKKSIDKTLENILIKLAVVTDSFDFFNLTFIIIL